MNSSPSPRTLSAYLPRPLSRILLQDSSDEHDIAPGAAQSYDVDLPEIQSSPRASSPCPAHPSDTWRSDIASPEPDDILQKDSDYESAASQSVVTFVSAISDSLWGDIDWTDTAEQSAVWLPMTLTCYKTMYSIPASDNIIDRFKHNANSKVLLHEFSCCFKPGELTAIVGPTGYGKTTLLYLLNCRLKASRVGGQILVNNIPLTHDTAMCFGYVDQHNYLHEHLTVRETLKYMCRLRFGTSAAAMGQESLRINEVLDEMGLQKCSESRIGGVSFRGISGGEKKRLSIAIELLKRPSVLILDEPTTGLDSINALHLVHTLKRLASRNRTVICTIHQPHSGIYRVFDNILEMTRGGHVVYYGPGQEIAINYFDRLGFICDSQTNPADHFLDLVSQQSNTHKGDIVDEMEIDVSECIVKFLIQSYQNSGMRELNDYEAEICVPPSIHSEAEVDYSLRRRNFSLNDSLLLGKCVIVETIEPPSPLNRSRSHANNFVSPVNCSGSLLSPIKIKHSCWKLWRQSSEDHATGWFSRLATLFRREVTEHIRAKKTSMRIFQASIIGVLIGLTFLGAGEKRDQTAAVDLPGVMFFLVFSPATTGILSGAALFHGDDRFVFQRENGSGLYDTTLFFVSKLLTELPFQILSNLFFCTITFILVGLSQTLTQFWIYVAAVIMSSMCGHAIGMVVSVYSPTLEVTKVFAPISFALLLLCGGYLINIHTVPDWLQGLVYINFVRYANEIASANQFSGIKCPSPPDLSGTDIVISADKRPRGFQRVWLGATGRNPDRFAEEPEHLKSVEQPCLFKTGEDVLDNLNFSYDNITRNFIILAGMIVLFQLTALIGLRLVTHKCRK